MNTKTSIWITWENQIRNKSMSARLGADFFPIVHNCSRIKRYIISSYRTITLLRKNANGYVFVQNPSIVLSFLSVLLKPIFRYTLVVDAHNSGVFPAEKLQGLANYINKKADYVIVTNEGLASFIKSIGGNPLVLPDPLPDIAVDSRKKSVWEKIASPSVLTICSWASDEPYCEVILAAKSVPEVTFYITGNSKGREKECDFELPNNIVLTGFVSENDYHHLLINSDIILDLTTRDDCLVCGAYEAVSVSKPVILSDTNALRSYFGGVAVFVKNDAESIACGVKELLNSYSNALVNAQANSVNIEMKWQQLFNKFCSVVFCEKLTK